MSAAFSRHLRRFVSQRAERAPTTTIMTCGVMSGTSLDGIDLCLLRVELDHDVVANQSGHNAVVPLGLRAASIVDFETVDMTSELRGAITSLLSPVAHGELQGRVADVGDILRKLCAVNADWSRFVAVHVRAMCMRNKVDPSEVLVGSHGQTIWHISGHSTLQIGDGELLAHLTGCCVVSNFRAADVAVGGTGAPLVPYFDAAVAPPIAQHMMAMASRKTTDSNLESGEDVSAVVFQNLGGIANLTHVALKGEQRPVSEVTCAFDTGPANIILNEIVEQFHRRFGKTLPEVFQDDDGEDDLAVQRLCDYNACYSRQGRCLGENVFDKWRGLSVSGDECSKGQRRRAFLDAQPPKSTGREEFGAEFVRTEIVEPAIEELKHGFLDGDGDDGPLAIKEFFFDSDSASANADDKSSDRARGGSAVTRQLREKAVAAVRTRLCDLCRTAVEFTAITVHEAYCNFLGLGSRCCKDTETPSGATVVVLSGGGAHHPLIHSRLCELVEASCIGKDNAVCGNRWVVTTFDAVMPSSSSSSPHSSRFSWGDAKEAAAFALMAVARVKDIAIAVNRGEGNGGCAGGAATNVAAATGAQRGVVLGQVHVPTTW